jgi:hypothetical protein
VIITAGWYHESAVISYRYRQFVLPTGIDGWLIFTTGLWYQPMVKNHFINSSINEFKSFVSKSFDMKLIKNESEITLLQSHYVEKVLS